MDVMLSVLTLQEIKPSEGDFIPLGGKYSSDCVPLYFPTLKLCRGCSILWGMPWEIGGSGVGRAKQRGGENLRQFRA